MCVTHLIVDIASLGKLLVTSAAEALEKTEGVNYHFSKNKNIRTLVRNTVS